MQNRPAAAVDKTARVIGDEAIFVVGRKHEFGVASATSRAVFLKSLADENRLRCLTGGSIGRKQQSQGEGDRQRTAEEVHESVP